MDWGIILILSVCLATAAIAAVSVWSVYKIKKEVYLFENQVEQALDYMITGQSFLENTDDERYGKIKIEELTDTLWGKCGEKIERIGQIWKKKERKSQKEKNQIKELIADISHQTKTPIANMKLYLEFLHEEPLSKKGMEFLKNMEGQTAKLDFLLQSMVKMSRLEVGVIQIKCEQYPLYKTLSKAASQIVPSAAKKGIKLYIDCDKNIKIWHDRKWIEEAIFNVLDNAVKYTHQGGHIHVYAVCQEIYTKISILDDGKGIAPERQAEIFTRFYREPEIHEQNGIGIGLYLTRQILEMSGGYIEVHSEPGKGSEFCLYLPI